MCPADASASLIDRSSDSCKGSGKLEKDLGYCSVSLPSCSPLVRFAVARQFITVQFIFVKIVVGKIIKHLKKSF